MKTRSQEMAVGVWEQAEKSQKAERDGQPIFNKQQYGGMAHFLPTMISTCGLTQALAFVLSRGKDGHKNLLNDLALVLGFQEKRTAQGKIDKTPGQVFWCEAIQADLPDYMLLSQRSIEALLWFKRFAQSELKIENGAEREIDPTDSDPTGGTP